MGKVLLDEFGNLNTMMKFAEHSVTCAANGARCAGMWSQLGPVDKQSYHSSITKGANDRVWTWAFPYEADGNSQLRFSNCMNAKNVKIFELVASIGYSICDRMRRAVL